MGGNGGHALKYDKIEGSGLIVLFIGVILLAATFYSAYMFLVADITILTSVDLAELFGNALAPLIEAVIHILYLGVMGWIGSILTIRAVQLLKKDKETTQVHPQAKPEAKKEATPIPQKTPQKSDTPKETKEEKKPDSPPQESAPKPPAEPQREASSEKSPEQLAQPTVA